MVFTIVISLAVLDRERLGEFIGQQGCNIKRLEKLYHVIIRLQTEGGNGEPKASITGAEYSCRLAALDLQADAIAIRNRQLLHTTRIPARCVGFVIGRNGAFFRQVRDRCSIRLNLDKDNMKKDGPPKPTDFTDLHIQGTFESVRMACDMIADRLSGFGKDRDADRRSRATPHFMADWGELNEEQID